MDEWRRKESFKPQSHFVIELWTEIMITELGEFLSLPLTITKKSRQVFPWNSLKKKKKKRHLILGCQWIHRIAVDSWNVWGFQLVLLVCDIPEKESLYWWQCTLVSNRFQLSEPCILTFNIPKSHLNTAHYIYNWCVLTLTLSGVFVFIFYDSECGCLSWKKQHHACLTLFPLSIHYAIKSRFADDVNEANCIPVRVSRLGKQTSASQLNTENRGAKKDIQAFQVSGLNAFLQCCPPAECITTMNHKINQSCIQSGYECRLLMRLRHAFRGGNSITVAAGYTLFLLTQMTPFT